MTIRAVVRGVGHHLPDRVVPNSYFEATLDTTDEWIRSRSGIERRYFAAEDEFTSDLGTKAAQMALEMAGLMPDDIDAVIVATSTPDMTFPSAATMIQHKLGMTHGFAYDVQAVCAGFVYALASANGMIATGLAKRVLVIGSETFSRILDFTDRATCVLFGDGAGALILEAVEGENADNRGILGIDLNSDGRYRDMLYVDGGMVTQKTGFVMMQGNALFRQAVEKLASTAQTALDKAGLGHDDVDWIVPHQANIRIIQGTAKKLGISMDKVVVTVQDHGNTSAASIPMALSVGVQRGQIKEGDVVVTEAIGGGLAWGAVVLRW